MAAASVVGGRLGSGQGGARLLWPGRQVRQAGHPGNKRRSPVPPTCRGPWTPCAARPPSAAAQISSGQLTQADPALRVFPPFSLGLLWSGNYGAGPGCDMDTHYFQPHGMRSHRLQKASSPPSCHARLRLTVPEANQCLTETSQQASSLSTSQPTTASTTRRRERDAILPSAAP